MGEFVQSIPLSDLVGVKQVRIKHFVESFTQKFKQEPSFVICSPGRINLIGDHIDYHGFAVLPMAIEKSILMGCKINNDKMSAACLSIHNFSSEIYPPQDLEHSFTHGKDLDRSHMWHNYLLCGYHGTLAQELLGIKPNDIYQHAHNTSKEELQVLDRLKLKSLPQLKILVDSNLPAASGLSSSSALVCGSAVASTLFLRYHLERSPVDQIISGGLADACSKFEHLIGTHGGGMDQAVIMTAQQNFAKYVEFVPSLRFENVKLPEGTVWLVSHSGVDYPKAATTGYNARVLETKLGAAIIAKSMNAAGINLDRTITLRTIKDKLFKDTSTPEIIKNIRSKSFKDKSRYTVDQVCAFLEMSRSELIEKFNASDDLLENELNNDLEILSRCEHVLEEADRVQKFKSICDTTTDISLLGQLMTQSHYSLRDKYSCSHPALDRLVSIALDAGALGSRLTGAGWGGCVVSLVEVAKCRTVFERLSEVSKFTFRSEPQTGCQIIHTF